MQPNDTIKQMRLKLSDKFCNCSNNQLEIIQHELTVEDCEHYDKIGWDYYREEDLQEIKLPELGNSIYFKSYSDVVVEIKGKRYRVTLEESIDEEPYECDKKYLNLEPTEGPLTVPMVKPFSRYGCKFFGQPVFIQNPVYPKDKLGNPCYHLLTVENGWGDSGNYNIFIGFDENNEPNVAFFEASCC